MSQTAYGWIINNVRWTADPALRYAVVGTPGANNGFDAKKDGRGLFLWLLERRLERTRPPAMPHTMIIMSTRSFILVAGR